MSEFNYEKHMQKLHDAAIELSDLLEDEDFTEHLKETDLTFSVSESVEQLGHKIFEMAEVIRAEVRSMDDIIIDASV